MDNKAETKENGVENAGSELPDTATAMAKTTTISTIAVQSGKTRIVIALLHVRFQFIASLLLCEKLDRFTSVTSKLALLWL